MGIREVVDERKEGKVLAKREGCVFGLVIELFL